MADKFRTQDEPLTGLVSYTIDFPAAPWFIREFLDAFSDMLPDENWEKVGDVTVEQATQAAQAAFRSFRTMVGSIVAYISANPPDNALPCDGTQYARVDYPQLYDALDSAFIDDEDYFTLPDLRGRAIIGVGAGAGLTTRAMGDTGGEEVHSLTVGELPSHAHSDTGHYHSVHGHLSGLAVSPGELPVALPAVAYADTTSSGNAAISSTGSDTAHNTMPPFVAVKYAVIAW